MKKTIFSLAALFAIAPSAAQNYAVPEGGDPVIAALDPLMADAPKRDVMGLRIGMSFPEVRAHVESRGFTVEGLAQVQSGKGPLRSRRHCPMPRSICHAPLGLMPRQPSARRLRQLSDAVMWSCRFWPTPGRACCTAMPWERNCSAGPTPEHISSCGEP